MTANSSPTGDMAAATYEGPGLMIPFQRVIVGWGVRKSWLDKVGEPAPKNWEDVLRVARKFQDTEPRRRRPRIRHRACRAAMRRP